MGGGGDSVNLCISVIDLSLFDDPSNVIYVSEDSLIIIIIIIITFIPIKLIYNETRLVDLFTTMIGKGRSPKTVCFVCHCSGMP